MPSKKKKYNARFPAGRIKKIMQTDEEVGKVAQAVPVIISRTLELFVESLLTKAMEITSAKNAKTLSPSHMKQCILSEQRFDFLKELVATLPDVTNCEVDEGSGPPITSPPPPPPSQGNNFATYPEDTSPNSRRQAEGPSRSQVPTTTAPAEETRPISLQPPLAATSTRMNANFYKESEEVCEGTMACALTPENSAGSRVDSAMQNLTSLVSRYPQTDTSVGIDEDYDTT